MKKFITSELMSEEQTQAFRLKEPPYIIAIAKSNLAKYGITDNHIEFELIVNDNKITLIGPTIQARPRGKPLVIGEDTAE